MPSRPRSLSSSRRVACLAVACAAGSLFVLPSAQSARADDWLALMPCTSGARPTGLHLLYPRAGLPAVVHSGDVLVARVELPAAQHAPPGTQRFASLRGYRGELRGYGVRAFGRTEHRYALPVTNVWPDSGRSLVYRVRLEVPAWVAPGTYDLTLRVPGGGEETVRGVVRVLDPGRAVRVAELGSHDAAQRRARATLLAWLSPDVWIAADDWSDSAAPGREGPPAPVTLALPPEGIPVVVRVGDELLVLGRCEPPDVPFDDQLAMLARRAGLEVRERSRPELPRAATMRAGGAPERETPVAAPTLRREDGGLVLLLPAGAPTSGRVDVLFPAASRGVQLGSARRWLWPATPIPSTGRVPTLAARVVLEPGVAVRVSPGDGAELALRLRAEPAKAGPGEPVRLAAEGLPTGTRVFWSLPPYSSHMGASLSQRWGGAGTQDVDALAISPAGAAAVGHLEVVIGRDASAAGCAVHSPARPRQAVWLLAALAAWKMRRRQRRRNILVSEQRSRPR